MGINGVRFHWSLLCPVTAEPSAVSCVTEAACHVLCQRSHPSGFYLGVPLPATTLAVRLPYPRST